MKSNQFIAAGATLLLMVGSVQASELKIGDRLPLVQAKSLTQNTLKLGTQTLRVVGNSAQGTLVVNPQGVVGLSRHEVLVSGVLPEQVQAQVARLGLKPTSAGYYNATGLSSLHFATLDQAAQARSALKGVLPKAVVSLPVQYAEVKPR